MASGIGPIAILPGIRQVWQNMGGGWLDPNQRPPVENWFGTDPTGAGNRTIDWGQQGLFVSRGPQSTTYDPTAQWSQIQTPVGLRGALFGGDGFGQSSYSRFQDAGDSYLRRYGTNLVVKDGQIQLPFLDAQGKQVGYGQGGVAPNPAYSDPQYRVGESPEAAAGRRSIETYGGRDAQGNPLTGSTYGPMREFA